MHKSIRGLVPCLLASCLFAGQTGERAEQRQPTLKIRLLTGISTYTAKTGTPFTAVVIAPYEVDGSVIMPRDSLIYGSVSKARRVGFGLVHERASLSLSFDHYELPNGDEYPFAGRLIGIDNAREQVKPDGTIQGILAARNPNGLINGFWYRPDFSLFYRSLIGLTGAADQLVARFDMGPVGAAAFLALHCTMFRFPEPEIRLTPGTDMELDAQVATKSVPSFAPETPAAIPDPLATFVNEQPRNVTRVDHRPASDIINVVFVGSQEELTQAFLEAGWFPTDRISLRNYSHIYASFSAMQTYRTAPVSRLVYRGELPEYVFQKSFNTVSKRHHVRIWHSGKYEGKDVWLGAATHDTGVTFRPLGIEFQHKIDPEIDAERSKIVNDLLFAGCSEQVGYVQPQGNESRNSDVDTDQRIAVLFLGACTDDQRYSAPSGLRGPATWVARLSRRLILETRNYLTREQPYYWGYRALRLPFSRSLRPVPEDAAVPAKSSTPSKAADSVSTAFNSQTAAHAGAY